MKKILVSVLVLLSMLMMFVGTVAAAPQMGVTFQGGTWTGHGVNFKFKVDESIDNGNLSATVTWEGGGANMTCVQKGDIVTCTGPKTAADKNIVVSFKGLSYSTYVKSHSFCYGVYDWPLDSSTGWVNYGSYCQDTAPNYGDWIFWYNADWDATFPYEFMPESPTPCIFDPEYGDAYYYPGCPY